MTSSRPAFRHPVRVYYEDTDCMGIVYHGSYLRFLERARTEMVGAAGQSVAAWAAAGIMFPVYSIHITYRSPARLAEDLVVLSTASKTSPFRITFQQRVEAVTDGRLVVQAVVDVVCTDTKGTLRDAPALDIF